MEKRVKEGIKRIVLIGAESTGKTEITEFLAKQYNTIFVPEYARKYIESLNRRYTYEDVEHIAQTQVILEEEFSNKANEILFYDTYLIITKIWFKLVYKKIPEWIDLKIRENKIDLFLLCNNDIPWVSDSVRENGGEMRNELYRIYEEELNHYKFNYKIVEGEGDLRFNNALKHVNDFFQFK